MYEKNEAHTVTRVNSAIDKIQDKTKINFVKIDDHINIGNTFVDVLYTYNSDFKSNFINNSSTIFRFNIEGSSVLFLGDSGNEAGDWIYKKYGDDLKSDIVQMAHHGSNGIKYKVYNEIDPQVCLWPTPEWLWNNNQGKGYNTGPWETIVLHKYMEKIGINTHYVSMNGLASIEFPLETNV